MDPFLGEIKVVSFGFPPRGWGLCNGQLLPISQNQALFSILGTTYGGNGQTTFALPNLQGRAPVHAGSTITLGQSGGEETHALTQPELATHQHAFQASADFANASTPGNAAPAAKPRGGANIYAPAGSAVTPLNPQAIGTTGGSQPHENMQPFLTLNFIIALQGIFPSRN